MDDDVAYAINLLTQRVSALEAKIGELTAVPAGPPPPGTDPELIDLIRSGKKINAIKRYRDLTDSGLAEAKDAVEAIERGL